MELRYLASRAVGVAAAANGLLRPGIMAAGVAMDRLQPGGACSVRLDGLRRVCKSSVTFVQWFDRRKNADETVHTQQRRRRREEQNAIITRTTLYDVTLNYTINRAYLSIAAVSRLPVQYHLAKHAHRSQLLKCCCHLATHNVSLATFVKSSIKL